MDFFEHQQRSRLRSRRLIALFAIAVIVTAAGVTVVVALLAFALGPGGGAVHAPDARWLVSNSDLLTISAVATVVFIGLASWYRLSQLRSGGSRVAEALGGTSVGPDDPDTDRRLLYNVVEEMAIASGLPVPAVFVLERENGINAFAAGRTPSDAAVAVTRGCLDQLTRDELQGVIGHEFSHILHGDMTLNLRLMGYLFGIMAVSMVGRAMARTGGRRGVSSRRGRGAGVIALAGGALYLLGYVGVLVGRLIQAAVCRQREFLADASSVQFNRQADGLAEALRKIGGYSSRSYLRSARAEEVSHMLFASGRKSLAGLFATHPPIEDRLRALQPHWSLRDTASGETPVRSGRTQQRPDAASFGRAQPLAGFTDTVGAPDDAQIQFARALETSLPVLVREAAHRMDGAIPVVIALILDDEDRLRAYELNIVEVRFGKPISDTAERIFSALRAVRGDERLALLDLAFPAVRRMERTRRDYLLETMERIADIDGRHSPFEAALLGAFRSRLRDLAGSQPRHPGPAGVSGAATCLIARMARVGHVDQAQATAAFRDGLRAAGALVSGVSTVLPPAAGNEDAMGRAIEVLDELAPPAKRRIVSALAAAAASDGEIADPELAMLRAVCSALHCPVPPQP
jgi:Zn-dependent protease with chaperone function/uncharacterized tellurite resistance protein B-like protein